MTCAGVKVTPLATGILTGGFGDPKSRLAGVVADAGVYATTELQMPSPIGLMENCVNTPAVFWSPFTQRLPPTASDAVFAGPDPGASAKVAVPSATHPAAVAEGLADAVTVPHGHLKNPAVGGVAVRVGTVAAAGVAGAGGVGATVVGGALAGADVAAGVATQLATTAAARISPITDGRTEKVMYQECTRMRIWFALDPTRSRRHENRRQDIQDSYDEIPPVRAVESRKTVAPPQCEVSERTSAQSELSDVPER